MQLNSKIGAVCLVASTAIGAGMIVMPMLIARLGIVIGICCLLCVWLVAYFAALISLELNIYVQKSGPLGLLCKQIAGKKSQFIADISSKILSYALISAYFYGCASVINSILLDLNIIQVPCSLSVLISIISIIFGLSMTMKLSWIDQINRVMFFGMLIALGFFVFSLVISINFSELQNLPWQYYLYDKTLLSNYDNTHNLYNLSIRDLLNINTQNIISILSKIYEFIRFESLNIFKVLPIITASFGFHVIFHTLIKYCNRDIRTLKQSVFYGSLIIFLFYVIWLVSILGAIYQNDISYYRAIVVASSNVDIGNFTSELAKIINSRYTHFASYVFVLLAILTSAISIGISMVYAWESKLNEYLFTTKHDIITKHDINNESKNDKNKDTVNSITNADKIDHYIDHYKEKDVYNSALSSLDSTNSTNIGLVASNHQHTHYMHYRNMLMQPICIMLTIIPPIFISINVPSAFTEALRFSGVMFVIIAIIIPSYLLYKIKNRAECEKYHYSYNIVRSNILIVCCLILSVIVIIGEIINVLSVLF